MADVIGPPPRIESSRHIGLKAMVTRASQAKSCPPNPPSDDVENDEQDGESHELVPEKTLLEDEPHAQGRLRSMTAEGSARARVGRGGDEPTTRGPRTPRSVALVAQNMKRCWLRPAAEEDQAARAGSRGPCRPRPPESPVPTSTAWIALPDVATRNGTETRTTGRADEIKNLHRFLASEPRSARGTRISSANCCEVMANPTSTPAQIHSASKCAGDAREPELRGQRGPADGIRTARASTRSGTRARNTTPNASHRLRPRPVARSNATKPASSAIQLDVAQVESSGT